MKDKEGNKITTKEFMQRWKEGIQNITPIQKLQNDSRSTFVTLVGFIISLIALIVFRDQMPISWLTYGLILIFVGSVWSNGVKWLMIRQQVKLFKNLDSQSLDLNSVFGKMEEVKSEEEVKHGIRRST